MKIIKILIFLKILIKVIFNSNSFVPQMNREQMFMQFSIFTITKFRVERKSEEIDQNSVKFIFFNSSMTWNLELSTNVINTLDSAKPIVFSFISDPVHNIFVMSKYVHKFEDIEQKLMCIITWVDLNIDDRFKWVDDMALYIVDMRIRFYSHNIFQWSKKVKISFLLIDKNPADHYLKYKFWFEKEDSESEVPVYFAEWLPKDLFYFQFPDIFRICYSYRECMLEVIKTFNLRKSGRQLKLDSAFEGKDKYLKAIVVDSNIEITVIITNDAAWNYKTISLIPNKKDVCHDDPCGENADCNEKDSSRKKPFICKCKEGYFGFKCEFKSKCVNCAGKCKNRGKCTKCKLGWTGDSCTIKTCDGLINICSGKGQCELDIAWNIRKCICDENYMGNNCEIFIGKTETEKIDKDDVATNATITTIQIEDITLNTTESTNTTELEKIEETTKEVLTTKNDEFKTNHSNNQVIITSPDNNLIIKKPDDSSNNSTDDEDTLNSMTFIYIFGAVISFVILCLLTLVCVVCIKTRNSNSFM